MVIKRTAAVLFLLIASAGWGWDHDDGGNAAAFTLVAGDARFAALGGASVGAEGIGALYSNPSGLATVTGNEGVATYRGLALGRRVFNVGYARRLVAGAAVGVGWTHAGTNDLMGRSHYGNPTGPVANSQNLFAFGFGRSVGGELIRFGFGGRLYYSVLDEDPGTGYGADAGVSFSPARWLVLSGALRDLGTTVRWSHADGTQTIVERVPTRWAGGVAIKPGKRLTVYTQADAGRREDWRGRGGVEYWLDDRVAVRGGYNDGAPTAGAAVVMPRPGYALAFEYGWAPEPAFGSSAQTVSLTLSF